MPFSSETIRFLTENRRQNSRAWFEEHREEYELYVMEPLKELTAALGPYMRQIDEELTVEPRVDRTISRIRRDTEDFPETNPSIGTICGLFLREVRCTARLCPDFTSNSGRKDTVTDVGFMRPPPAIWIQCVR